MGWSLAARFVDLQIMPFVGSIIPPSSFGNGPEKRVERKRGPVRKAEAADNLGGERDGDEVILSSIEESGEDQPDSGSSSNDSEAGHEDRAQHGAYAQDPAQGPKRPHIDVQG
jgi:hypothetical protein